LKILILRYNPYPQLLQLLQLNPVRRVNHHIPSLIVFRECDEVADRVCAVHHGIEAVEAEGNAAMWGRAIFERAEQEAKLGLRFFGREPKQFEIAGLQVAVVDTDRAAAYFYSVDYKVISIGAHGFEGVAVVAFHFNDVSGLRRSKGVVHGEKAIFVFVPFK